LDVVAGPRKKGLLRRAPQLEDASAILVEPLSQLLHCEAPATWQAPSLDICTEKILLHEDGRRENCKSKKIMMIARDGWGSKEKY